MVLSELLKGMTSPETSGNQEVAVAQVDFDSRRVIPGSAFVAVRGTQVDGHDYIGQALSKGASVIVAERAPNTEEEQVEAWVKVPDSGAALGELASAFYGYPSRNLRLVGVTGTNGKTTTTTLLYDLFAGLGYRVGLLSTIENRIGHERITASLTTPDAVQINASLAKMRDTGCDFAFMEVSSHATDQGRIAGLHFAGAVFTNMSHDHLDYHKTFKAYIAAKKKFFDLLPASAFALVNIDDKRGEVMLQNTAASAYRYSLRSMADFRCRLLDNTPQGLHLSIGGHELFTRIIGAFNAYNLLACYGVATLLGEEPTDVLRVISELEGVEGRISYVQDPKGEVMGVVDYSHTPDALDKVLTTLREMLRPGFRILTVVGCGGDRDRTKRPIMAKVATQLSDEVILTSDNPRTEDPEAILDEMEIGVPEDKKGQVLRISQRKAAIQTACRLAKPGDLILVAGKGHEKYQEINGVKHPFDDTAVLQEMLALR